MFRFRGLALAGLTVLALSACGGRSGDGPTTSPPTTDPSPPVQVPNVVGGSFLDGEAALNDLGFHVKRLFRGLSSSAAETVLTQIPDAGTVADVGAWVTLTVPKEGVTVPDVVGGDIGTVSVTLQGSGIGLHVKYQLSDFYPGTITRQSIPAGSVVRKATVLTLTVAKQGPVEPPPCDYDPCLPLASDYDCFGGSGNGPAYTQPGVVYRVIGFDRYGLDGDGNGYGCE